MTATKQWFEVEEFWDAYAPWGFTEARIESAAEEIEQALALLGVADGAAVLDLCCGVGRHSLELARRGFAVTGADRNANYLATANERAAAEGLSAEFVRSDMRTFRRPHSFDAAVSIFTSFGYFEDPADDRRVVENLFESLRPGGRLLIEMMGKEVLARHFQARDWHERDGALLLQEREVEDGWAAIRNRWIFVEGGDRRDFHLRLRCYSAVEISDLLRSRGFKAVKVHGDLAGAAYDHRAKRLIAVAMKPKG